MHVSIMLGWLRRMIRMTVIVSQPFLSSRRIVPILSWNSGGMRYRPLI
jgi:hypothetical protein